MSEHQIVGDRFVSSSAGEWIDLVTGDCVPAPSDGRPRVTSAVVRAAAREITEIASISVVGIRVAEIVIAARCADVALAAALDARELGYVTVRSSVRLPPATTALLVSRHLLVLCWSDEEREAAIWWTRRSSRRSPRGHLVVVLTSSPRVGVVEARERAVAHTEPLPAIPVASPGRTQLARADRWLRKGRHAAARRWLTAAMANAERDGDRESGAAAARKVIELAFAENDLTAAKAEALAQLDLPDDASLRAWFVGAAAAASTWLGELGEAEALLAGAEAEAVLRRTMVPGEIQARQAELRFWRGRFDEDRAPPAPLAIATPELVAWTGLAGWARGDWSALDSCRTELSCRQEATGPHTPFWTAVLTALGPDGARAQLDRHVTNVQVAARADGLPRRARALAQAIAAEACLTAGEPSRARLVLTRRDLGAAPLDALLLDWLRAAGESDGARSPLRARIRRVGAEGMLRWGMGDKNMHLVHGLPALMQLVQDADDELAALTGGCTWVRRHTAADRVGIVDADGTEFLAADGWTAADLFELKAAMPASMAREAGAIATVWAQVRYGRVLIGRVVARGRAEARVSLEPAVQALAALVAPALRTRLDALALSREAHVKAPEILGRSAAIALAREAIGRAATTAFPVLIEGESGTGKELVARALHRLSPRRDRPFAAINCAALTDELVEAEMFGHVRGAFTGAVGTRTGLVEQAHGGTLFLDEVSELSPRAQAKLLRVLQEREIRRVGENAARHVDVRIVAATNRRLAEVASGGLFREDLLFRLAVVRIRVPPLRDRLDDVPLLAQAFWRRMQADTGKAAALGPDALATLCRHTWPGNVRELQNAMAALAVIAPARGRVSHRHVRQVVAPALTTDDGPGVPLETARRLFEQRTVAAALARNGGRRIATANELGLTRQGLAKALRRLGLSAGDNSAGVA